MAGARSNSSSVTDRRLAHSVLLPGAAVGASRPGPQSALSFAAGCGSTRASCRVPLPDSAAFALRVLTAGHPIAEAQEPTRPANGADFRRRGAADCRRASRFAGLAAAVAPQAHGSSQIPRGDSSRSSPSSRGRGRASGAQGGGACATYVRGRGRESGSGSPTCGGMSLISLNWVSRMYPVVGRKGCSRQLLSPAVPEPDLPGGDIWPAWGQRLLRNAKVCSHVAEIRLALAEGVIQREITDRNARVGLLQDLVDRIRKVIAERGADMADVPGGSTGLLVRDYKGKNADAPVYKFDAALVEQMNATCKQVAIEVGQWS